MSPVERMKTIKKGLGYVNLTLLLYKDKGGKWVSECVEFTTIVSGTTKKDVETLIKKVVIDHLNSLEEIGERERFFKKHNIEIMPVIRRDHKDSYTQKMEQLFNAIRQTKLIYIEKYYPPLSA